MGECVDDGGMTAETEGGSGTKTGAVCRGTCVETLCVETPGASAVVEEVGGVVSARGDG